MIGFEIDPDVNAAKPSVKILHKAERVASWFLEYIHKYITSKEVKIDPFDTLILKAHYNFTAHLLITIFVFVTSHWFVDEPIICIDRSDKSRAPEDILDICLTYPYVEFPLDNDKNRITRRYALHYKWVHIACLIISFLYKVVVIMQRIFGFKNHRELLQNLCDANLKDRFWIAKTYFINHNGCHKNMYAKFLYIHLSALVINILSFIAFNITFQNHYVDLPKNLLISRDPTSFHDPFSLIFPPFVKCEVNPVHHIVVGRAKWYGCHLPLMEIYEKVFMMFWFWQVFLFLWTLVFICQNIPLSFWFRWKLNLLNSSSFNHFDPYKTCARNFSVDEIFALRSIRTLILGDDYVKLLLILRSPKKANEFFDPNDTLYYDNETSTRELNFNETAGNASSFHSCNQGESKRDLPPIGFDESLLDRPKNGGSAIVSSPVDETHMNQYSAWKRSISLEFDTKVIKKTMGFDSKLYPLMQYLRRDEENICRRASTSHLCSTPSAPKNEEWERQNVFRVNSKNFEGGEKHFKIDNDWGEDPTINNVNNDWGEDPTINNVNNLLPNVIQLVDWPTNSGAQLVDWPTNSGADNTDDENISPQCTNQWVHRTWSTNDDHMSLHSSAVAKEETGWQSGPSTACDDDENWDDEDEKR